MKREHNRELNPGGGIVPIKEKSSITLEVDGRIVERTFHDANDAWEKGVNRIM